MHILFLEKARQLAIKQSRVVEINTEWRIRQKYMVGKEKKLCWNPLLSWQWRDSTNVVSEQKQQQLALTKRNTPASRERALFPFLNSRRRSLHGSLYQNIEQNNRQYLRSGFAEQAARQKVHGAGQAWCVPRLCRRVSSIFDTSLNISESQLHIWEMVIMISTPQGHSDKVSDWPMAGISQRFLSSPSLSAFYMSHHYSL